jgi:hypothetical protein
MQTSQINGNNKFHSFVNLKSAHSAANLKAFCQPLEAAWNEKDAVILPLVGIDFMFVH